MTSGNHLHQLVVSANGWFSGLSPAIQGSLLSHARSQKLVAGEWLYEAGDSPDGVYCVVGGCIRAGLILHDAREVIFDFFGPGSWFGEVAAFGGTPRVYNAIAYEQTSLLHVNQTCLEKLVSGCPEVSRAFLKLGSIRQSILLWALKQYSLNSIEQRLASRLLILARSFGTPNNPGVKLSLHLPQEVLAQLIGATRQRVNQILKDWEAGGLIRQQYGLIVLLNESLLEKLVDEGTIT